MNSELLNASHIEEPTDDPCLLWAEIYRLRALLTPPDGFNSWKDAAINERLRRVRAENEITDAKPIMRAYADNNPIHNYQGVDQDPNGVHAWMKRNET